MGGRESLKGFEKPKNISIRFLDTFQKHINLDLTKILRNTFKSGKILHYRAAHIHHG